MCVTVMYHLTAFISIKNITYSGRPKYKIRKRYTDQLTGITFEGGHEVEVVEEIDGKAMFRVERIHDKKVGWIPKKIGQQLENEYQIMVNFKSERRKERLEKREKGVPGTIFYVPVDAPTPSLETEEVKKFPSSKPSVQKIDQIFSEFVNFVSKTLEDLNTLNSRYVTNAALNPQNGILQDGEYRRLFARIPKLIQFLNNLMSNLKKCNSPDGDQICQLLLDAVTTDYLESFKDYTVNFRFQKFTLSYLRRKNDLFVKLVKKQDTKKDTLDLLLVAPCFFIDKFNYHIKRFQEAVSSNPEANVVRLAHDLTQYMKHILRECKEQDNTLQEREEKHVSKILLKFEESEGVLLSEKEKQISNESWAKTWNDVIVYSRKKRGSKDWEKIGSNVKLVTFERVVMLIDEKHHKIQNEVCYNLIDCANKNCVKLQNPSSDTYPFKVPKKKGVSMDVFFIVMHTDKEGNQSRKSMDYYVCWEPSHDRSFEFWRKSFLMDDDDDDDDGELYASWSRPKYKIATEFHESNSGNLEANVGDKVEITDRLNGWVKAINLTDNRKGWIPDKCLGESILFH
ncbi:uncharacterized protein [Antedon mediterranea]|uniref:uncharacterized protein n=1 Tax=Antedon mediterranea TaxID=105859 RepID=UPI003AF44D54